MQKRWWYGLGKWLQYKNHNRRSNEENFGVSQRIGKALGHNPALEYKTAVENCI